MCNTMAPQNRENRSHLVIWLVKKLLSAYNGHSTTFVGKITPVVMTQQSALREQNAVIACGIPPAPTITLRPWRSQDAEHMAELVNNPAVYRTLAAGLPTPYRVEHALGFIAACNSMAHLKERAIVRGGEIVGTIGATLEGRRALIGYWLGEAYWRQGIMSAALPRFIAELPARVTQLRATCFDFNPASIALLQRCGFVQNKAATTPKTAWDGQEHPVLLFERDR